jgi:hypothetical protein
MLEPILKETYGIIVYQEQVMQIAQVLSGYSLGEADLLRRAMGKKIKAEMDAQRRASSRARLKKGVVEAQADTSSTWSPSSPTTASTRATPRLRAGRLPDGLAEGELPGRVPRRVDDARHGQHRQAAGVEAILAMASRTSADSEQGQSSLFGSGGGTAAEDVPCRLPKPGR